jgi:hypothetical protein
MDDKPRTNIVKDEKGDLVADCHSIIISQGADVGDPLVSREEFDVWIR